MLLFLFFISRKSWGGGWEENETSGDSKLGFQPKGIWKPVQTTKASIELPRELLGFAQTTWSKSVCSCAKSTSQSLPRKILATNVPPGVRTHAARLRAERRRDDCTYSSRSCNPVTSGAPSEITRSAFTFSEDVDDDDELERCLKTNGSVEGCVISACRVITPGMGVIGCKSRAIIILLSGKYLART